MDVLKTIHEAVFSSVNETKQNGTTIPTTDAARKASNHMVKHYAASRLKNWSTNSYSSTQCFNHVVARSESNQLQQDLVSQGWVRKEHQFLHQSYDSTVGGVYTHPDGGHIRISRGKGSKTDNVDVFGTKKAKPSDLPYYD